jgi:hypothetical protein
MFVDPVAMKALQNMLAELDALMSATTVLSAERMVGCRELVHAAHTLTRDILQRSSRVQ